MLNSTARLDVVAIGSAIVDLLVEVDDDELDRFGLERSSMTLLDEQTAEEMTKVIVGARGVSGGSAANTAVGLVSLGGTAGFIARTAADELGAFFAEDLRAAGVEFEHAGPLATAEKTGRCIVLVTPDGERTMGTYLGASALISSAELDPELIGNARVCYLEGYLADAPDGPSVLREAMKIAKSAGGEVAVSLSDGFVVERHRELFLELAPEIDLLFGNETEVALLGGTGDFSSDVAEVAKLVRLVVVTRGAAGAVVTRDGMSITVPAVVVERVVDTTGAGDLFAAGFLFGHTRGRDPASCARCGAATAAEVISHLGARPATSLRGRIVC